MCMAAKGLLGNVYSFSANFLRESAGRKQFNSSSISILGFILYNFH